MYFLVGCESLMPIINLLKKGVLPIIFIVVPIALIILGVLDLAKAVIASKEDEIKSAQKMLIKRCVYCVAMFFVPFIVNIVIGLVADSGDAGATSDSQRWSQCWSGK